MDNEMKRFFCNHPDSPLYTDSRSSVHKETYRLDKAKEQASLPPAKVETIIAHVNDFLKAIGADTVELPIIHQPMRIDYEQIKDDYALKDKRDIVWMKFTADGYLGVVATSDDINFDIPLSSSDYNRGWWSYRNNQKYKWNWKHNTSGILVHQLGKEWDTSFVLVFPLGNIPAGYERWEVERAIGNYLIDKGIPIIDFYSHNNFDPDYQ